MKAAEIAKLPTPRTSALMDDANAFVLHGPALIIREARTLEQQLAAAVMALEDGALVFADTKWAASVRETLAAIKETDSSAEPKS